MEEESRIVHEVYEAAGGAGSWDETSRRIAEFTGGGAVHLLLASLDTGTEYVNLFARGDPDFAEEYLRDYAAIDFRVPRVMGRRIGLFADEREYVSVGDARESAIHQELLPRYAIHNINGANMSFEGCVGWFGISNRAVDGEFDPLKRRVLERLSPHIANALRIAKGRHELNLAKEASFAALELVNGGVIILQGQTITFANETARRLLADGFFVVRSGRLACVDPPEQLRLAAFLRDAANGGGDGSLLLRHVDAGAAYMVRTHDLAPRFTGISAGGIGQSAITIVETSLPAAPLLAEVVEFCARYGVSRSEAMVIHAILNATELGDHAEASGKTLGTVRQQLKAAMAKMEVGSQKKIVQAYERYRMFDGSGG